MTDSFAPLAWLPQIASSSSAGAIPYRTQAAVSSGSAVTALLATLVLLALLVGVLLWSRRRGWLPGKSLAPVTPDKDLRVVASRRVSIATTVHVVEYRGQSFLLTESARGASVSLTPVATGVALVPEADAS